MLLPGGWIQDYPDPQNWLSVYFKCDATFAKRFAYCNPEFDKLVTQADQSFDQTQRMELYQQAGQILVDDIPSPFLYNLSNIVLVKPNVTGYKATAVDAEWPGQFTSLLTVDKSESDTETWGLARISAPTLHPAPRHPTDANPEPCSS